MKMDGSASGILIRLENNDQEDLGKERIIYYSHYFHPKCSEVNCLILPRIHLSHSKTTRWKQGELPHLALLQQVMVGTLGYFQSCPLTFYPENVVTCRKREWLYLLSYITRWQMLDNFHSPNKPCEVGEIIPVTQKQQTENVKKKLCKVTQLIHLWNKNVNSSLTLYSCSSSVCCFPNDHFLVSPHNIQQLQLEHHST